MATYYVATNGDDGRSSAQAQNINTPWATWQKPVAYLAPGDTVYIRGGTYTPSSHLTEQGCVSVCGLAIKPASGIGVSGTSGNRITIEAYPSDYAAGNPPILDCHLLNTVNRFNVGIGLEYAAYITLRGLIVENVTQTDTPVGDSEDQAFGFDCVPCANLIIENCISRYIDGRGFYFESWAWNTWDGTNGYGSTEETHFINCDSHDLFDRLAIAPGDAADGYKCGNYVGSSIYFYHCRAWNYSDDGFDPGGAGDKFYDGCWARSTTLYAGNHGGWNSEGNGFKAPAIGNDQTGHYTIGHVFNHLYNCIAADCFGVGIYTDLQAEIYGEYSTSNPIVYNCFVYNCEAGYMDAHYNVDTPPIRTNIHRNNIAFGCSSDYPNYSQCGIYYPNVYTQSNNSWRSAGTSMSWPGWELNPVVSISEADFVSLDSSQLVSSRKSDGSLPDITFGHLVEDSDLIGAGIKIQTSLDGIDLTTDGEDNLYNNPPSMGPFEYNPLDSEPYIECERTLNKFLIL